MPFCRTLLYFTMSVWSLDSEMYRVIIFIPGPTWVKLPIAFLLTPRLHYLLISSPQKCSARSENPLKSSAVSTPSRPLLSHVCSPCFLSSLSLLPGLLLTLSITHAHIDWGYLCWNSNSVLWGTKEGKKEVDVWKGCVPGKGRARYPAY